MKKVLIIVLILLLSSVLIYFKLDFWDLQAYKHKQVTSTENKSGIIASRGSIHRPDGISNKDKLDLNDIIIKAMTYNIHRGINKSGKINLDDISSIIKASEVDIIAVQEVERYSIRTRFTDQIELLAKKLSMNYAYGKSINILNGQYGNAILSKYPIEEYKVFELPYKGERRTLLRTLININGYRLYAFSTHLGLDLSEREEQIEAIKGFIADSELEYILMGDFNTSVDKLNGIKDISSDVADIINNQELNTYESGEYSERIDYIFLSENLTPLNYSVVNSDASDHYPVVAEIQVK